MPSKSIVTYARMTTKGRVTVPKAIRDKYGMLPGTRVLLERTGDGLKITSLATVKRRETKSGG